MSQNRQEKSGKKHRFVENLASMLKCNRYVHGGPTSAHITTREFQNTITISIQSQTQSSLHTCIGYFFKEAKMSKPAHPSYAVMITAAIAELKDRSGSSRQAIVKCIKGRYSGIGDNCSRLVTKQVKALKEQGLLKEGNGGPFKFALTDAGKPKPTKPKAKPAVKKPAVKKPASKKTTKPGKKTSAKKPAAKKASDKKKSAAKKVAKKAKTPTKKNKSKSPAKKAGKKPTPKKPGKKPAAKKTQKK